MNKGDLVLGYKIEPVLGPAYGIILKADVLEGGDLIFMSILWQDGIISDEFSDELRLFL